MTTATLGVVINLKTAQALGLTILPPVLGDPLESIIERNLQTFVDVSMALLKIRDNRLYLPDNSGQYDTFDDYCRERWGFSRQRAPQMIEAASVSTMVDTSPKNEAQARELVLLAEVDPEAAREVWSEVQSEHGSTVTAASVRDTVSRRLDRPQATRPTPDTEHVILPPSPQETHRRSRPAPRGNSMLTPASPPRPTVRR